MRHWSGRSALAIRGFSDPAPSFATPAHRLACACRRRLSRHSNSLHVWNALLPLQTWHPLCLGRRQLKQTTRATRGRCSRWCLTCKARARLCPMTALRCLRIGEAPLRAIINDSPGWGGAPLTGRGDVRRHLHRSDLLCGARIHIPMQHRSLAGEVVDGMVTCCAASRAQSLTTHTHTYTPLRLMLGLDARYAPAATFVFLEPVDRCDGDRRRPRHSCERHIGLVTRRTAGQYFVACAPATRSEQLLFLDSWTPSKCYPIYKYEWRSITKRMFRLPVLVCCTFCVSLVCLSAVPSLPQHRPLGSHALTRHKVQLLRGTRDSAAARLLHLAVSSCRMSELVSWQHRGRLTIHSLRGPMTKYEF